jgi:hypothetical protein
VRPSGRGTTAASAGRSTSSSVPRTIFAIVQHAAVFPAEKNASAAPSRTFSCGRHRPFGHHPWAVVAPEGVHRHAWRPGRVWAQTSSTSITALPL